VCVFLRMTCYPDSESSGDGLSQERVGLHRALDPPAGGSDVYICCAMDCSLRVHAKYVTGSPIAGKLLGR
jgi:hypothetical protein